MERQEIRAAISTQHQNTAHIKENTHTESPLRSQRDRKNNHYNQRSHMHLMSPNNSSWNRSDKISLSELRRNNYLAMLQMPKVRKALPLPKMRLYWSLGAFRGPFLFVSKYALVTFVFWRALPLEALYRRIRGLLQLVAPLFRSFLLSLSGSHQLRN